MAFNSADINAFKDIWVFCEQRNGELMNTDFELISEGRKLADERGSQLVGILLGHNEDDKTCFRWTPDGNNHLPEIPSLHVNSSSGRYEEGSFLSGKSRRLCC